MNFFEARRGCAARKGHLLKIDSPEEAQYLYDTYGRRRFGTGMYDASGKVWKWDGDHDPIADPYTKTETGFTFSALERWSCTEWLGAHKSGPYLRSRDCLDKQDWICEGSPTAVDDNGVEMKGDLEADEGGFCLWYLKDPSSQLPDDESRGFRNTELNHKLLLNPNKRSNYFIQLRGELYAAQVPGSVENAAHWDTLTYMHVLGVQDAYFKDNMVIEPEVADYDFHCHFSPTNYGMARIYTQQHMLERIYPGAYAKHCFCGFKNAGHLVSRCDCTRAGNRNGECQQHHRDLMMTDSFKATGENVFCNRGQCDRSSPGHTLYKDVEGAST
jgi:hypothetical protein